MIGLRCAACLALLPALAACGVGPVYRRPALDVPPAYAAPVPQAASPVDAQWWHGFGAPELDRLIGMAAAGSPDVEAAAARVIEADQAARIAGSPLLPSLSGSLNQSWQRSGTGSTTSSAIAVPGGSRYFEQRSYSAELSASYEVDFWGKNRAGYRAAEATAQARRFDAANVWLTTASSIATTYFQAISYRDRLEIARGNLRTARDVLDAFRARLEVGTANALDVSQQEALVAGYQAQIPALDSLYRQQALALGILVGQPPERVSLGPAELVRVRLPAVAPGIPADVLRRRPDVASAEAQLIAQNQTVRQDVANFFPSLQLTASGGLSSVALSALTGPGTLIASLAGSLTQTIFDNGLKSGTLGQAKGLYRELAADYAKSVLQALTDVETALTQVKYTADQEALEAEAVRRAQHSIDIVRAQLQAGTVDIVTVLNTQTTLFNDQDSLAQVRVSRVLALVSLYKALGGGWQMTGHGA